jgi:uncharacterized membrane protein
MFGFVTARPRLFASIVLAIAAAFVLPHGWMPRTRALCAWDLGICLYLALTAVLFCSEHLDRMAADAARQQEGEWTIFAVTVAVVVASYVAIFGEFSDAKDMHGIVKDAHVGLIALTLFASWMMLHATFCFRYAHEFYTKTDADGDFDRGLDFPSEKWPDYLDFSYFALVLGMTFQVSDVQITSRKFRRLAALHGLLSFLFNTVIVALTVNIGASLL